MPEDRKKMFSKKGTGTVPKVKYRNNSTPQQPNQDFHRNLSNNLDLDWERYGYSTNSRRNYHQLNPNPMESYLTEDHRPNGAPIGGIPVTTNGTLSRSSTSGSNSRRDSIGTIPKCDNVKKCPDKKHIEDKLSQIREYLQVTTSLMSSIKNNEDQSSVEEREQFKKMIKDLKDSEAKLLALLNDPIYYENNELQIVQEENHNMDIAVSEHMQRFSQLLDIVACQQDKFNNIYNTNNRPADNLMDNLSEPCGSGYQRNEVEEKVEVTNRKVQLLREQQNALITLKRKAENQLRDARQAQENLLAVQEMQKAANELRKMKLETYVDPQVADKNMSESRFDITIRDLEDRLRCMRNDSTQSSLSIPENARDEYLQGQLENSNQVLHLLDNRDSQLNTEHMQLQQNLNELQNKKIQIDHLAEQLQTLGEDDDEDIGNQVRKIVTMKQQLSSLKDLLEIVKNTESSLLDSQNLNELEVENQENAQGVCIKTDNIRQDVRANRVQNGNSRRLENNATQWFTEKDTEKDSNNSLMKIQEREKVLSELKTKKRELLEIMYKQKDRTLINNDVCSETCFNKSEIPANNNVMLDNGVMSWLPAQPNRNDIVSAYSSDDCPEEDINEYSDLNSATDVTIGNIPPPQPALSSNYSSSSFTKRRPVLEQSGSVDYSQYPSTRSFRQFLPTASTTTPSFQHERMMSNTASDVQTNKIQVQKQLELIQSVCQSLLDQQQVSNNVQQLRNNLTPSPMYTEPRSYMSLNPQRNSANPSMHLPYLNAQAINPQYFPFGDVTNSQNMLAANTLQTQAFLLNTLNQCCQMLWFQQREIASLHSMMCTWQDQILNGQVEQDVAAAPAPHSSSFVFPGRPVSSLSNVRSSSQSRNMANQKVHPVSAACSLPNLNPATPQANTESAFINQSNVRSSPSARLLESSLNNTALIHSHHNVSVEPPANNTVLPSVNVNAGMNQPLPSQIWNGQALNNQVAPGNRANNYWDNFRSYSRQNLLSTSSKSNEVLQNPSVMGTMLDRSNSTHDHSQSFSLPSFTVPKLNMVHNESTNAFEGSPPRRQLQFKLPQNSNKPSAPMPPDVLNINHHGAQKTNEPAESVVVLLEDTPVAQIDLNGASGDNSTVKESAVRSHRNRNEWNDNEQSENTPRSKLFEELRDKVYKEVANLISANESRPHFLIQLFRDLQSINSDPLRGRTLQSIQTVITNSLGTLENNRGASRQLPVQPLNAEQPPPPHQQVVQVDSEFFSLQPTWWSQSPISTSRDDNLNLELENEDPDDIHGILKSLFTFLKAHDSEIFEDEQIELLKVMIIKSTPFIQILANTNIQERTFQKQFIVVLNDASEKFKGQMITDIKTDLLKSISDVLLGEFSFTYLAQETIPENGEVSPNNDDVLSLNLQPQTIKTTDEGNTPQMQNGDLAEADQSRIELHDEEGAVGGVLNVILANNSISGGNATDLVNPDITDMSKIDFPVNVECEIEFTELGLDQVPTRLTTKSRSHSNTPSRDRSNSSRSDPTEHF